MRRRARKVGGEFPFSFISKIIFLSFHFIFWFQDVTRNEIIFFLLYSCDNYKSNERLFCVCFRWVWSCIEIRGWNHQSCSWNCFVRENAYWFYSQQALLHFPRLRPALFFKQCISLASRKPNDIFIERPNSEYNRPKKESYNHSGTRLVSKDKPSNSINCYFNFCNSSASQ